MPWIDTLRADDLVVDEERAHAINRRKKGDTDLLDTTRTPFSYRPD